MRYKVGDKVKIRSLEWYNENKDEVGSVVLKGENFVHGMSKYCGKEAIIIYAGYSCYKIDIDGKNFLWNDYMFEYPSNCAMGINKPSYKLNVKTMEQKKTFEPFERVIYKPRKVHERQFDVEWMCGIFSHEKEGMYVINGAYWDKKNTDVLPFEGNSHLVGTREISCEEVELKEGEFVVVSDSIDYITKGLGNIRKVQRINERCICISYSEFYKYCIPFSKFNPNDMEETRKHILTVKNGKLVKARV